jgi:hypothetical protein
LASQSERTCKTIVRLSLSIPVFGLYVVLFGLCFGIGCSGQPTSVSGSLVRPIQPSSDTGNAPGVVKTSKTPDPIVAATTPIDSSVKAQLVVDRIVNSVFQMDGVTWVGLAALVAMLTFYTLEDRSPLFTLGFAAACWLGSAYGYLKGSLLIGTGAGIWGCLALRKCWREIRSRNGGVWKSKHLVSVWHIRFIGVLAVISGIVLLIVDAPFSTHLPIPISRPVAEAVPLLLVGIAFLAWLAVNRPAIIDLIKQVLIAVAFLLWGFSLLMPSGQWSRFVGDLVIAIYVFDLTWLIEGNLRKRLNSHLVEDANGCVSRDSESAGVCVCVCQKPTSFARGSNNRGHRMRHN